jgi:class 3 adenylate cyclase/tetratricopeptide (TPR) repeat protein
MSQTPDLPLADERLRRYLPADLFDAIGAQDAVGQRGRAVEAFVHLRAARYAISTYLPRALLRAALDEQTAPPWLQQLEGALLFADLSGSTALAERLGILGREGTELVTDALNAIFATMAAVVERFGGDLVAFGGDALLVLFEGPNHTHVAAAAALALQEQMRGYVRSVPGMGSFPMKLHIGVESGPVGLLSAGGLDELHHTVLGETVNGVATAEDLAGPGEVVLGPRAWSQLQSLATGESVGGQFVRLRAIEALTSHKTASFALPVNLHNQVPHLLEDLERISPYLPAPLLRRILAAPERPQVEADLRPASMVFAQVVGLEALAEQLPAPLAARAITVYVEHMQTAAARFGGVVNKLDVAAEGVKLLAIFGAPAAYEDHAERATRAALAMQAALPDINREIEQLVQRDEGREMRGEKTPSSLVPRPSSLLRQRIGVNLGTAFAGNVGTVARKEYTVMGDAVNVAARVMGAAAWGEVWCSEAVARTVELRLLCEPRGRMALKGKSARVMLYRIAGERDATNAVLATYRDMGLLVGRTDECAWLRERLHAALASNGRAVRVVGDAGIGKSHLVSDLVAEAVAAGARVVAAACFSYTAGIPYAAWAEWLKALCGIISGDDDAARVRKLTDRLAALGSGMDEWLPLLGDLVRLDVPDNRLTRGLDPQLRQERRDALLEELLLRAADEEPLVTLFEDFQWADPISLDLWRRVTRSLAGRTALLVGVHRPYPALDAEPDAAEVLDLHELPAAESDALIQSLGAPVLPPDVRRQLIARAAGNPLFLAELVRAVTSELGTKTTLSSTLNPQRATFSLDQLPDSLHGLLLARADRLDESSRALLRVASVIGQRIPFGVLQSIHTVDRQALLRQLSRLDAETITVLERPEPPERVHAFRHAMMQEVVYQSMLYARRRELHGRIGTYLEQRHAADLDDYVGLIAHHYRLSDQRDKAATYLLRAGNAARAIFANDEAEQYYRWALDALAGSDDPRVWDVHDGLGEVYATVGRYEDALAQHAAVITAPGVAPDAARRAHRKRGSVLEKQGEYGRALEELDRAMAIATSGVPGIAPIAIPVTSADIGLVLRRRGEYDAAIGVCERGLAALRTEGRAREDELIEARLHSELGAIFGMRGDYPRARHHFARSLHTRELVDDLPGMVASHNNLGYLAQLEGAYEQAIDHYRVAEELARKIGLRYMLMIAALNASYAIASLGRYAEAEARCREALLIARELSAQQTISQIQNTLGIIFYRTGAYEQALAAYDEALAINRTLGSVHEEANALMHRAQVLVALGQTASAREAAAQALEQATALQAQTLRLEALNVMAEIALAAGEIPEAARHAEEAVALGDAIGSDDDAAIAQRSLGQARALLGEPFIPHFEAAVARFLAGKEPFEVGRTLAAYGAALLTAGERAAGAAYLKQARDTFMAIGAAGELRRLAPLLERSVSDVPF